LVPLPQPLMLRMLPRERIPTAANRKALELEPPLQHDLPMYASLKHCSRPAFRIMQNAPSNDLENL
jgi:hypothetical protein